MESDEPSAAPSDPLDGFVIPGSWPRPIPARPIGLEDFLAPSPVPNEPSATGEAAEPIGEAAAAPPALVDESSRPIHQQVTMAEEWGALSTVVPDRPFIDEAVSETLSPPRTIASEAAALAAVEPRALVAPADVLVEPSDRISRGEDHEAAWGGETLRALSDEDGLIDPSPWFALGRESDSWREPAPAAPGFGSRSLESSPPAALSRFGGAAPGESWERDPGSFAGSDRLEGPASESFEEIEARLSRIAARLEEAVDRIGSPAAEPLSARSGGFRGRVDE